MYFSTALIFLLTILNILVYYLQKQLEENKGNQKSLSLSSSVDQQPLHEADYDENKCLSAVSSLDKHCRFFSLAELKMATNDFDEAFVIGKGGFGNVYKGKINCGKGIDVAIKRLNLDSNQGATEFWAEIEMLSKFRHSHVVSLLGYHQELGKRDMILVYEYMPNGSLEDHLYKRRAKGSNSYPLTWVQRLNICIGAARGLDYLHTGTGVECRVLHRDVKSSNVLLDENLAAKISDFGVSRFGPAYQVGTTNVYTNQIIGTFGYMDAEYFNTHRLTRKSDVYAFGVVLLEALCGRPALDFTLDEQQHSLAGWAKHCIKEGNVGRIIDPCLKGQVSANCLKEFAKISYECLSTCSKDRPTMTKVLARLELVLACTLQGGQKHIRRAWSLFYIKSPMRISSNTKKLELRNANKKKGIVMEKHASPVAKSDTQNGGVAAASELVMPPSEKQLIPILKEFTFSQLQSASRNFRPDRVIGEGGFGKVYKGWLDSVTYESQRGAGKVAVAIKKSSKESIQGHKEWQAELQFLGKLSHPNLVTLFGYCQEDEDFLLVYDYMQKGSLDKYLFGKGTEPLPWYTRIKVAIGVAQALAFLHTRYDNVIYRDVKSSNILLDGDFNAKLSDFGLARLGPVNGESHVTTGVYGTYGYAAPEYVATGRLYIKSDVYSFGVVMLEIITGLQVLDSQRHPPKHNLVDWARPLLCDKKKLQRIIDPRLEQAYPSEGARKTAELIRGCLEPEPKNRPSVEEVVSVLQVISAIQMKAGQSKDNTSQSSNWRHQNYYRSPLGTKHGRRAWSTSNWHHQNHQQSPLATKQSRGTSGWLSGLRVLIGSRQDRAQTETNQTKTKRWRN